jgi:hypothetical protein
MDLILLQVAKQCKLHLTVLPILTLLQTLEHGQSKLTMLFQVLKD